MDQPTTTIEVSFAVAAALHSLKDAGNARSLDEILRKLLGVQ
jgi:hypothetical protein